MCGIVAYSGKPEKIMDILVTGLRRLEYRGYDSAGIAVMTDSSVYSKKAIGKIDNLNDVILSSPPLKVNGVGISHTRWATHGEANETNAHPHHSQNNKIWLVHNGIIENYQEIKAHLEKSGIKFYSDTDSEVIAQLIGYLHTNDLKDAVLAATKYLVGAYSLAVISTDEPDRLIGVKLASPLVVGVLPDEYIIASDVSAIVEQTKSVLYLEDGELIDVKDGSYEIVNFENEAKIKNVTKIEWDVEAATKGGYDHYLLKEIMEQPKAVVDSIRGRILYDTCEIKFGGLIDVSKRLKKINKVILIGAGTSAYCAKLGELYFNSISGVSAYSAMSPEFRYTKNIVDDKTWVIAVSQSGETADTIAAIREAKNNGALVTGIVNVVGSTIARETDAGVYSHIGPEISVASTKAVTSQNILLLMHAMLLGSYNKIDYSASQEIIEAIKKLPDAIKEVLKTRDSISKLASQIYESPSMLYMGRGYNYPVALEGALKIKEISYIHAEGLSGGELKHGFIALVDKDFPVVALATDDSITEKILSNVAEVKARKAKVILVANKVHDVANETIIVPNIGNELLQPIVNNVALQLLAYYVAKLRGVNIDQPRNLAKSVTVE